MRRVLLMTGVLCGVVWLVVGGVCAGAAWRIETVDTAGVVGLYTSLALEASRYPRISYYDETNGDLKYAVWNGISWRIMTVDSAGDVGQYTSLALDPATQLPHISYYDRTNGDLKYVTFWNTPPFGWLIYTVDSAGDVGQYTSLALDPATGWPRISYFDRNNVSLKYAAWNGSSWDIQTVDSAGWVGEYSSLMLDASGYPRISYYLATNRDLKYAAWNGSSWDIQTVDNAGWVGEYSSLMLDASGYPRISYGDDLPNELKYAAWNGASWDLQAVDSAGDVGEYTSLALDASGYPRISYRDNSNNDLKYAAWNGSSWDIETAQGAGGGGMYTSLALDANGDAHISYYQATMRDLKYATTRPPAEASHELPATGYYMISFPLIPSSATPHELLCDDLGDGSYYMWRWEGGGYQTIPTSPPGCQSTTLSIEEGYWILAQGATLDIGGTQPSGDQAIPLQAGWNMVAAPYEATMDSLQVDNGGDVRSLAEAQTAGWVLATFYYSHDGTGSYQTVTIGQTPADELSSWYGYWVLAGLDCSLIVPEPPGGAGGAAIRAAQPAQPQPAWAFDVRAACGNSLESITIATADAASDGFDGFALDKPKPPSPPGEGRLRMALREGWRGTEPPPYNKAPGRQMPWSSELAMETKSAAQEEAEWQFTVTGGVEGDTVTLSWPELSLLPKDRVAILTDEDTGKRTFMRTRAHYEFAAPGEDTTRSFVVTVSPAREGALLISGLTAAPTRGGTWDVAFNLSADAAVTARIYNIAGRLVADIAAGSQLARGRASLAWNARSIRGTTVPSGTYLLRVTARTQDGQEASAVTMLRLNR